MKTKLLFLLATASFLSGGVNIANASENAPTASIKQDVKKAELKITEDFDKALAEAKKEGKLLMLHFEGSDWCPPCKMLHKYVVNTEKFAEYAANKLKYVVSDWGRGSGPKSENFAKRHRALAEEFELEAFPTIVLINPQTNKMEKIVGFAVRTPEALIERIELFEGANKKAQE